MCSPTSSGEYELAHPTLRLLARRLASRGYHVLRFDYFGTGDSTGDLADATQELWRIDIETAVDELKDISGVARVSLVGLRYGAALAAQVAARRRDTDRLVLWDPVFDGRGYLAELERGPGGSPNRGGRRSGETESWHQQIETVTPDWYGPGLPRTLVLNTSQLATAVEPLTRHLAACGTDYQEVHAPDVQVWSEEWRPEGATLAVGAADRIAGWLS